jgi:hypothetical protein
MFRICFIVPLLEERPVPLYLRSSKIGSPPKTRSTIQLEGGAKGAVGANPSMPSPRKHPNWENGFPEVSSRRSRSLDPRQERKMSAEW